MNNRTMVKLNACGEILDIQTFSAEKQSPHRFAVLRSDLARLETQHQTILVSDLYSFAKMWLERISNLRYLLFRHCLLLLNISHQGRIVIGSALYLSRRAVQPITRTINFIRDSGYVHFTLPAFPVECHTCREGNG